MMIYQVRNPTNHGTYVIITKQLEDEATLYTRYSREQVDDYQKDVGHTRLLENHREGIHHWCDRPAKMQEEMS